MGLLAFYIALALGVSFVCSLLEATLLTLSSAAIEHAKQSGKAWGPRMAVLKAEIDRPLSAILTLNTIAHTMGAAGAGAEWAKISGNTYQALFAGLLTLAILILTEIIPKTLGATYAQHLAGPSSIILPWLIRALTPVVAASRWITTAITPKSVSLHPMHREELLAIARLGEEAGSLEQGESQFVHNLMQLHSMTVWDIMTPRPVIFALACATRLADFAKLVEDKPFTRIPVYRENRDDVVGFVIRGEVLLAHLKDDDHTGTLEIVTREVAVTPESAPVDRVFQRFIAERHQIMMVADEFGTTVGLVTFEDVIETIFGIEIMDEKDKVADLQLHARQLWHERAKRMGIHLPEDFEEK